MLHEVIVGVPLGLFRLWSFLAMLAQLPLAFVTDRSVARFYRAYGRRYLKGTQYGNIVMWASLFLGQPTAVMLYVRAYLANQAEL